MKKKVGIFGHFGFGKTKLNGQTVKTLSVAYVLEQNFGSENVLKKDTDGGFKSLLRIMKDACVLQKQCNKKVVLLAQNGLKLLLPILYALNGFSGKDMHFVVIGGWLPAFLSKRKVLAGIMKTFSGIYPETEDMVQKLRNMGFENVYLMPNFKPFENKVNAVKKMVSDPVMLCTFSRVTQEKGILEAIQGVQYANEHGNLNYRLTVYGTIEADYETEFHNLLTQYKNVVCYGGEVPFDQSVKTLKMFDALLFPTYYEGEGFAGTLIDAFYAGLPVIATDFKYNNNFVFHEKNGLLVPPKDAEAIGKAIQELFEKRDVAVFREESLKLADVYGVERASAVILENLE